MLVTSTSRTVTLSRPPAATARATRVSASADSELTVQKPKDLEAKAVSEQTRPEGTAPTADQVVAVGSVRSSRKRMVLATVLACVLVAGAVAMTFVGAATPGPTDGERTKDVTRTAAAVTTDGGGDQGRHANGGSREEGCR